MADDKKTQLGQTPGRTHRPTGNQAPAVAAATTPAPSPAQTEPSASSSLKTSYLPPQPDPLINTTLAGRYLIQKKLGEGGMGAVYLAMHNVLEKSVALKVLHGEFARKQDLVERFIQEAKAASRIRHENVIDISDFGATPDGYVFFAMELLKGHDLHDEVARARVAGHLLPWSRTKKIFLQICAALSAAHAKGIVHRDLKPENIYLVEFLGDPDFVKLLDFGIAKVTETEGAPVERKLTKTGMLFGTPEYMSPEQARGEQVDHRVDIYAMGCILFQLVTNRVPFEADNFMGVLSMHLTEPPPQIAPEVFDQIGAPRELAHVIDRALLKDRTQRYQTIDDLANAVREVCGDPIPTGKVSARAASVPSPSTTTTRRAAQPTGEVSTPKTITGPEGTGRIRTQWTGNISVPEAAVDDRAKPKSKLPLIIGGLVVAAGAAIAIAVVAKGGGSKQVVDPGTGSGSAIVAGSAWGAAGSGSATVTPPPPPPPEPKLPDMVKITLDTVPHGATVTDMSTGKPLPGKTPLTTTLPGAKATRQYAFHLRNYGDAIVELPLTRETINYSETLVKGASSGTPTVKVVDDATLKAMPPIPNAGSGATKPPDTHNTGSAAVTHPDTGSAATHPDTGSAAVTHPDTGSATPPKGEPCTDADDITNPNCLKKMPKEFGSGSGAK